MRGYYHLRNKQNVNQRIQKRHTKRCAFFLPFAQAQAAAYRSTPIQFPEKVQLCRTFSPLPVPQRHGLVRCADERGISYKVSTELCGYLRGTASPLEEGLAVHDTLISSKMTPKIAGRGLVAQSANFCESREHIDRHSYPSMIVEFIRNRLKWRPKTTKKRP